MKKLTKTQLAFLAELYAGQRQSPSVTRNAGRLASAWHRTVDVLVMHGFATKSRFGDVYICSITVDGCIRHRQL